MKIVIKLQNELHINVSTNKMNKSLNYCILLLIF